MAEITERSLNPEIRYHSRAMPRYLEGRRVMMRLYTAFDDASIFEARCVRIAAPRVAVV